MTTITANKFTYVRHAPDGIRERNRDGKLVARSCIHCGRTAVVSAIRQARYPDRLGMKYAVRYCDEHADHMGVER